ncbi:MAG TPA: PorV/PorQ family protein [bacterium]|nr:PorV/PorQ family protein [bacterium]HPN46188.1 PorV/PorQ family protein [bacterium]
MIQKCAHTAATILVLTLLAAFTGSAFGQSKVGTTAASFLGISVGPRATALGGAFAAVADDATSLYYNPAGIARAGRSQFVFAYTSWLVDTDFSWIGLMFNLDGTNAIGLSLTQLNYGEEEVTTVLDPEGTGEKWGASDISIALSYARNLTDRFSIGGNAKYIQEKLWNESASAFAFDVGLLYITELHDMRLGMSITNFGTDMRLDGKDLLKRVDLDPDAIGHNENIVSRLKTDDWPLPLFFRVGLAMDVLKQENLRLTTAIDALRPSDNSEVLNVGAEMELYRLLFLRGGYKSLFREDSEEGLTLGMGLNFSTGPGFSWAFDYTFADFGLLEDINMFSLGVTF